MGDVNIPVIEPTVDYSKVPPINQKRTIAFINHFISHTVTLLNKFSLNCEEKLFEFENKLQRVEASLAILESRISSVPELKSIEIVKSNSKNDLNKMTEDTIINENEATKMKLQEDLLIVDGSDLKASSTSDPLYIKYFKMVHVGVPKEAVKLKMQQEGLDPSALDNTN